MYPRYTPGCCHHRWPKIYRWGTKPDRTRPETGSWVRLRGTAPAEHRSCGCRPTGRPWRAGWCEDSRRGCRLGSRVCASSVPAYWCSHPTTVWRAWANLNIQYSRGVGSGEIDKEYAYLHFSIAGTDCQVLARLVPLHGGDVSVLTARAAQTAAAATLCVQQVHHPAQGNGQHTLLAPIHHIKI